MLFFAFDTFGGAVHLRLALDLDGSGLEGEVLGVDLDGLGGLVDGQTKRIKQELDI